MRAIQLGLEDERALDVARHEHARLEAGGRGIGGERITGVARRRHRQRRRAEGACAGDRRGLAARLEGIGGVEGLVLDVEGVEAELAPQPRRMDERGEALAERHG